jgi:hypothetical protein
MKSQVIFSDTLWSLPLLEGIGFDPNLENRNINSGTYFSLRILTKYLSLFMEMSTGIGTWRYRLLRKGKCKGKALKIPWGSRFHISRQLTHEYGKVSSLNHSRLYHPRDILDTLFCLKLSRPQGHGAARRIMLVQWFPTGVPRYPGVLRTLTRGTASCRNNK